MFLSTILDNALIKVKFMWLETRNYQVLFYPLLRNNMNVIIWFSPPTSIE